MEAQFWAKKWASGETAFHKAEANPLLVRYFRELGLAPGARVFVPLCGKTRDIAWLLAQGCRVVGVELVAPAVNQLFDELGLTPVQTLARTPASDLVHYQAAGLDVFVDDVFSLDIQLLGPVDAIYDRAALVALPAPVRRRYAPHLTNITQTAPQLLVTYEYDQGLMDGPPFSVDADEVSALYGGRYPLKLLATEPVDGGLKPDCPAQRSTWLLK